ncbi:YciI family protein [Corynebacterium halotolerans]|uniref:YciI family protein n=1 Tax=Corynebacterium halotolerans TaxID=225326 RepID=UPI003CEC6444
MAEYAVTYAYVPENDEMAAIRPTHVDFLRELHERGTLLVSGRLTECDPLGALLIIRGDSVEEVEATMDEDPIYSGGFVSERLVRRWNIAFGGIEEGK